MLTVTSGKGLDALSAWSDAGGASAAVSNAQGACLRRRLATEQRRVHLVLAAPADWLGAAREAARTAFASELAARLSMRAPYDEVVVEDGAMVARRPASRRSGLLHGAEAHRAVLPSAAALVPSTMPHRTTRFRPASRTS